jgi:hypothetical protein
MFDTSKTMNTRENLPEYFYLFVDMDNPITYLNLNTTKCLFSSVIGDLFIPEIFKSYMDGTIDYLPFVLNPNVARKSMSMYQNTVTSEYRTEYNCEIFRKTYFSLFPSRLSAIYAFGDYESCKKAIEMHHKSYDYWNIDSIKKFKLEDNPFNRVVKVNMEIVSWERTANRISSLDQNTQKLIWSTYWSGKTGDAFDLPLINNREIFKIETLWEYLIEGRIKLVE